MGNFFAELKRRQMFRVAAAYAVAAWLILQVVNNLAPGLNLPNWAVTLVIVLLGAAFPVALLFCWIQQLAPSGDASQTVKTSKVDYVLAGGLVSVIAIFAYQQIAPEPGTTVQQQQASVAPTSPNPQPGSISIAVLPFANLSSDAEQEFFSDGMTDEIVAALAKIQSLSVVGRSSAFQFKGQNRDLRAIGQALGARYLIDGSVRKEGSRVRISAQLMQADNGVGVWTSSYDRELTGLFATQEDIAQAIAGALRVPLGLQQGDNLVRNRTNDLESYQQYLRARALVRARGGIQQPLAEAVALLEQVVARDPGFAPAWALLAEAYATMPNYDPARAGTAGDLRRILELYFPKAEAAARRAIELDAGLAYGYLSLGLAKDCV